MASANQDPNFKQNRSGESELELYTIPSYSSWFSWDDIHETEKSALKEFFDGSSITRTPKIYKEYRDFIINKYREDPSRRLTFTEIRKSLVGDVTLLRKVFLFLEKWGLINFTAPPRGDSEKLIEHEEKCDVKVEEAPPNGVRVVALPNSLKPIQVPSSGKVDGGTIGESGFKFPPLASCSDIFGGLMKPEVLVCGGCGETCKSDYYECIKEGESRICSKCFKSGNYGENKSAEDFKSKDTTVASKRGDDSWTEAEILLLLDSVLKYGDDWELVAKNVRTKSKLDCISKLIELPFGQFMLGSADQKVISGKSVKSNDAGNQDQLSSENQETIESEARFTEQENINEQSEVALPEGPPSKRTRVASLSDTGSSIMKEVARISTVVNPRTTAAAAEAAFTALCSENSCSREIFDEEGDSTPNGIWSSSAQSYEPERDIQVGDSEMNQVLSQSEPREMSLEKDDIPLPFRIRTAAATALGSAAARAKLLADQEEREIEHLVAVITEAEMRKLNHKIKNFEDLELIMKKEYAQIEELKECVLAEMIDVSQKAFDAGIPKWRDHSNAKSHVGNLF